MSEYKDQDQYRGQWATYRDQMVKVPAVNPIVGVPGDSYERLLTDLERAERAMMAVAKELKELKEKNATLRNMLYTIAKHPSTPELVKQYAQGRLHSPNPLLNDPPR